MSSARHRRESPAAVLREVGLHGAAMRQAGQTSLKGGNLFIESISVPSAPVAPGGTVRAEVTVGNGALFISANEPDGCDQAPSGEFLGYLTRLVADPEWTTAATPENCVRTSIFGIGRWSVELTFTAPSDPGFYNIEFGLFLPNSETESGTVTRTIEVAQGGDPSPGPNGGDNGGDNGDGDGPLEQAQTLIVLVIVLILLFLGAGVAS